MSAGQFKVISTVIASGASTSSDICMPGRPYARYMVEVGTMSTAAAVSIQHKNPSENAYTTVGYLPAFHYVASASTQAVPLAIASGVGAAGGAMFLPVGGLRQIRFVASAVVSGGVSFNVVCSD